MKTILLLLVILVSGCTGYPLKQWRSDMEDVYAHGVLVHPVPSEDVAADCRLISKDVLGKETTFHIGCAVVKDRECWVIYEQPKDWYEKSKLAVVGEEVLHCFGFGH